MPYDGYNHPPGHHGHHHGPNVPGGYGSFRGGFIPNHFDWVNFNSESLNDKPLDSQSASRIHKVLGYTIFIGGIFLISAVSIVILFL